SIRIPTSRLRRASGAGRFIFLRAPVPVVEWCGRRAFTIELQMYSAQLLDHFQNPRNAGDVADADATVEIENPACGDILRLTLKISASRIAQARFKAKGCVAAIACGSAVTELVSGKMLNEAKELRRDDIITA